MPSQSQQHSSGAMHEDVRSLQIRSQCRIKTVRVEVQADAPGPVAFTLTFSGGTEMPEETHGRETSPLPCRHSSPVDEASDPLFNDCQAGPYSSQEQSQAFGHGGSLGITQASMEAVNNDPSDTESDSQAPMATNFVRPREEMLLVGGSLTRRAIPFSSPLPSRTRYTGGNAFDVPSDEPDKKRPRHN